MDDNQNERRLTRQIQQQAGQIWGTDFAENMELAVSVPRALSAMGLGQATTYLEKHPEYLSASLKHSDWTIRAAAVQVVGKQGKSIEALLNALHDENVSVRATATRTLGIQGKKTPIEPLVAMLQDSEWRVRTAAALALGRLHNRTPVEPLLPVLHDENASVRAAAVWALGTLGERAPIEPLVTALQDKAWAVREAAVMSLQEQGERVPTGSLLAARWDEDSSVRDAADATFDQHFNEQEGQKILPSSTNSLSWLRLALAALSVCSLIPLTSLLTSSLYIGRFALVSELAAIVVVCIGVALINILYQRKQTTLSNQKNRHLKGTVTSWQNVVLAGISVLVLGQIASFLLQMGFAYDPIMIANTVRFILVCRLIALGVIAATVIVINKVFFTRY